MAAEIHQRAPARPLDIPEPVGVRSGVLLALLHEVDATERALVRHPLRLDVLRREEQLLGVQQQDARPRAGVDHRVSLFQGETERFLTNDVLARACGLDRDPRMEVVGRRDPDHVDVGVAHQLAIVAVGSRHAVPRRELAGMPRRRRGDGDDRCLVGDHARRRADALRLKPRPDDPDPDSRRHGIPAPTLGRPLIHCCAASFRWRG